MVVVSWVFKCREPHYELGLPSTVAEVPFLFDFIFFVGKLLVWKSVTIKTLVTQAKTRTK